MKEEIAALVRFHKAFELRQTADYRALQWPSGEDAQETLAKAVRFVQCLKDYLAR